MSKVTSKYQITIPSEIRRALQIMPGMQIDIIKEDDKYILAFDLINEIKKKWQGKFKDVISTDKYMDEIRGKVK